MSIMSWERRGAERHSTGSRWAHRPTLAASTMVHLAVAYPTHLITNLLIDSSTKDRGRPQSSRCWDGKPHLLLCLPLFEAGSQLLPVKLTTLSHPPQTDPFPCIFSLYISPPKAPHMLETCLDRLPQREIYPKPVQISTTEPSHHRNFHMYLSHMDGWRVPKASKQSGSLERLCDRGGHSTYRHGDIDQH